MDKKRKILDGNTEVDEDLQFTINSPEGAKYEIKGPEGFIIVERENAKKAFDSIAFDNSRLLEVMKALGFNFNKEDL